MIKRTNVLIVDDHAAVREALRVLLGLEKDIFVVGDAKNGEEAITETERLSPDVIVMDYLLPDKNGLETTKIIKEKNPGVKVIVLSIINENEKAEQAKKAGVERWISKGQSPKILIEAIRELTH